MSFLELYAVLRVKVATSILRKSSEYPSRTVWVGERGGQTLPVVGLFEVIGDLEGWCLVQGIYTPRGQRPRRILFGLVSYLFGPIFDWLWPQTTTAWGTIFVCL